MIERGVVTERDFVTCRVRVRLLDRDGMVTRWLPVVQPRTKLDRAYHLPDIDEHVAVGLDEHREDGVVLGAVYSAPEPPPVQDGDLTHYIYEDGAVLEYDRRTHRYRLDVPPEAGAQIEHRIGDATVTHTPDEIRLQVGAISLTVTRDEVRIHGPLVTEDGATRLTVHRDEVRLDADTVRLQAETVETDIETQTETTLDPP